MELLGLGKGKKIKQQLSKTIKLSYTGTSQSVGIMLTSLPALFSFEA